MIDDFPKIYQNIYKYYYIMKTTNNVQDKFNALYKRRVSTV
jgi:hypothetical protein